MRRSFTPFGYSLGWLVVPWLLALVVVAAVALPSPMLAQSSAGSESTLLPPEECVRLMRSARIARLANNAELELEKIREAREVFPEELTPIFALMDYQRRHGASDELKAQLRADLVGRLENPELEVPSSVISHLLLEPDVDDPTLQLLAEYLEGRVGVPVEGTVLAEENGPDRQLLELLATLQQRLGQTEAAAVTRLRLWKQTGADEQLWPLIRDLQTLGRWSEAADHLKTLVEGGAVYVRPTLIQTLVKAERFDEALAQVDLYESVAIGEQGAISTENYQNSSGWLDQLKQIAWNCRDLGRDDVAEALFRRVIALNGGDSEARAALLHLYGSAEEQASHAAAIERRWKTESDPQALLNEGAQLLSTGDAQGAYDLLKRAAPYLPEVEAAWYNLGMAAYRLEEWKTVDEAFAKAAKLNPKRAQSFYFRAIGLVQLSKCRDAIQPFLTALQLDPARTQAHYYLAGCYRGVGDSGSAAKHRSLYDQSR